MRHISSEQLSRRRFCALAGNSLGVAALASLLQQESRANESEAPLENRGLPGLPHFAPRAKRVIYLFQSGAPSQLDLFDYKPALDQRRATELPDSVRMGQRLTGMTAAQQSFPIAPTMYKFKQHGASGAWLSDLLPHTAQIADEL